MKKHLIEESLKKMKNIVEARINEAPTQQAPAQQAPTQQAPAQQAPAQQAPAQQAPAQQDPQRDQKIAKNIDVTMDQAMNTVVAKLPSILANFAKTSGDKDGSIDAPGVYDNNQVQQPQTQAQQPQAIKEGVVSEITFDESKFMQCVDGGLNEGGILGLAMSAPAILKYGGQASKWIGKKMDSQWLQKWGNKTAEAGEKLHHKYIHTIEKVLKPLMPNATPEQLHKAANGVFLGAVGVLFAGSLAHPGMLTGIKGAELGQEAIAALQKSLPSLGFA